MRHRWKLLIISILFILSCEAGTLPYLLVEMDDFYYEGGDISVYYEFVSESEVQPCRIRVWDKSSTGAPVWDNDDRERDSSGTLSFLLGEGAYTLEFTLLSERDGELTELSFLSKSLDFTVAAP